MAMQRRAIDVSHTRSFSNTWKAIASDHCTSCTLHLTAASIYSAQSRVLTNTHHGESLRPLPAARCIHQQHALDTWLSLTEKHSLVSDSQSQTHQHVCICVIAGRLRSSADPAFLLLVFAWQLPNRIALPHVCQCIFCHRCAPFATLFRWHHSPETHSAKGDCSA